MNAQGQIDLQMEEKEMKDYYYYFRDKDKKPVVTVCLLADWKNNDVSRGIAICSKKDSPCKKAGRKFSGEISRYQRVVGKLPEEFKAETDVFEYYDKLYLECEKVFIPLLNMVSSQSDMIKTK